MCKSLEGEKLFWIETTKQSEGLPAMEVGNRASVAKCRQAGKGSFIRVPHSSTMCLLKKPQLLRPSTPKRTPREVTSSNIQNAFT